MIKLISKEEWYGECDGWDGKDNINPYDKALYPIEHDAYNNGYSYGHNQYEQKYARLKAKEEAESLTK